MKRILCLFVVAANIYAQPNSFKVEGVSMLPTIRDGSTVLTDNNITLNELRDGDIVVFLAEDTFIVHRLHKKDGIIFTKGDNNALKDRDYLSEKTFIGKVIKIY